MGIMLDTARDKIDFARTIFRISIDLTQIGNYYLASRDKEAKKNLKQVIKNLSKLLGQI